MPYVAPISLGLIVLAAGLLPWMALNSLNARIRPDLPWSAVATVAYLAILITWLGGIGLPKRNALRLQQLLRLWPFQPAEREGISAGAIVGAFGVLYALWIAISLMSPQPDLSEFTTTAQRWSLFLMGGITAGVVEEVAFRGYMQSSLEQIDRDNAIWITSIVFALSHITQGVGAMLMMAPGLFVASVLFGMLARRTGSILPGMLLHVTGDLARVFFGVLRGDASLLFVN